MFAVSEKMLRNGCAGRVLENRAGAAVETEL